MQVHGHDLGVCSWSLRPKGMEELVTAVKGLGLDKIQLALLDLVMLDDKRKHQELGHLGAAGIGLTGTMISFPGEDYATIDGIRDTGGYLPDDTWPVRKRLTESAAALAAELGAKTLMTHIGFVPHKGQHGYDVMLGRVREIAAALARHNLT